MWRGGPVKAFVILGPGEAGVGDVPEPVAGVGEVVVAVERAGVCGTDFEFFSGAMHYLSNGQARYPMRIGHEWCGTVVETGEGVHPAWTGRRVVGDTMLGCGHCRRCRGGHQHVCAARQEVGIRGGRAGALAERMSVPVTALHELPPEVDATAGALVEPGGNALRAAEAALGLDAEKLWAAPGAAGSVLRGVVAPGGGAPWAGRAAPRPGGTAAGETAGANGRTAAEAADPVADGPRVVVYGPGTIGLLTAMFLRAAGAEAHLVGVTRESVDFARRLGFPAAATPPEAPVDAVVDATGDPAMPAAAVELVEPAGRVVYIGLAGVPSSVDMRQLVLKDITAVGILSASPGLEAAIGTYASGDVDPRPLVAGTVGLAGVAEVFAGWRPEGAGPKVLVDPRRL